jgi:hypothetical protein
VRRGVDKVRRGVDKVRRGVDKSGGALTKRGGALTSGARLTSAGVFCSEMEHIMMTIYQQIVFLERLVYCFVVNYETKILFLRKAGR